MDDYYKNNTPKTIQVTSDGKTETIFNGIADWLYEEEILYQPLAMYWSPNSRYLAYIKFNDTDVEYYTFPIYDGSKYNSISSIRYPKSGTKNPSVQVYLYDSNKKETKELQVPNGFRYIRDIVKNSCSNYNCPSIPVIFTFSTLNGLTILVDSWFFMLIENKQKQYIQFTMF